jgi:hypothetical protein
MAAAVGIPLGESRIPPLTFGIGLMRSSAVAVMSFNYGRTEPAPQFRPTSRG